ncbi:hypothetical protein NKH77_30490 [Streptomyces sp. M19]
MPLSECERDIALADGRHVWVTAERHDSTPRTCARSPTRSPTTP